MAIRLLDVNVLVALSWTAHVHHARAQQWFAANSAVGWATTAITQAGFVRVSSNPKAVRLAMKPSGAIAALEALTANPHHIFWHDTLPVSTALAGLGVAGHQQVTDAYLVGLARHHGGILVTFDRAIATLAANVEVV